MFFASAWLLEAPSDAIQLEGSEERSMLRSTSVPYPVIIAFLRGC